MVGHHKLVLALWVAAVSGIAGTAFAQCPWDAAPDCGTGAPPFSMCDRNLAAAYACQAPVNNGNGTVCNPASAAATFILAATQTNAAFQSSAFCSWNCTNGTGSATCRINLSDGLPIELMEFSVESSKAGDGQDQEGDTETEEGTG